MKTETLLLPAPVLISETISLPYLEDFVLYYKTNDYSVSCLKRYEEELLVFQNFLISKNTLFRDITKKTIMEYKVYLKSPDRKTATNQIAKKELSACSVNRNLTAIRSYLNFLIKMDYKIPLPPAVVERVKEPQKHYRLIDFEDIVKLIEFPSKIEKNKVIAIRNRAMLETLFSTGMRISELLNLKREQIDKTGRIFIRGKGKKERFVYLTPRGQKHIVNYLAVRDLLDDQTKTPFLFIPYSGKGNHNPEKSISSTYLQTKIKTYREKLGILRPVSCHTIRHAFATYLAENGAGVVAIQVLLGHESLDTTTKYINTSDKFAERVFRQFHPLKI